MSNVMQFFPFVVLIIFIIGINLSQQKRRKRIAGQKAYKKFNQTNYLMQNIRKNNSLSDEQIHQMEQMNLVQLQQFALEQDLLNQQQLDDMQQEMMRMHDPYLNPGLDAVVDATYHGIDNGLNDHHHHDDHGGMGF